MRIIAGPCQFESFDMAREVAEHCKGICDEYGIEYYFKASFDKANRSKGTSARGVGLKQCMDHFWRLKAEIPELKTLTDVHETHQVYNIASEHDECVDVLQIPALLSRQTDLIKAASLSGKIVNIKKGQFMSPYDCQDVLDKASGAREVWLTERGTSFGYNRLVVDFVGLNYMINNYPDVVFDVTHSIQNPAKVETSDRSAITPLACAAAAMGVQNFFFEVHPDPDNAKSDGPNSLHLSDFKQLVCSLEKISKKRLTFLAE
jgi:2-dehydro-3-deoxyphosphooctonate aldolase (KDO 8-P synthase)